MSSLMAMAGSEPGGMAVRVDASGYPIEDSDSESDGEGFMVPGMFTQGLDIEVSSEVGMEYKNAGLGCDPHYRLSTCALG